MSQTMPIKYLFDPTSSKSGKFYIGIEDDRAPITSHGPNTPGAGGRIRVLGSAKAVTSKLREKMKKSYYVVSLAHVPSPAIDSIRNQIANRLGIDPADIQFGDLEVNLAGVTPASKQPARKPRRRRSPKKVNVWI